MRKSVGGESEEGGEAEEEDSDGGGSAWSEMKRVLWGWLPARGGPERPPAASRPQCASPASPSPWGCRPPATICIRLATICICPVTICVLVCIPIPSLSRKVMPLPPPNLSRPYIPRAMVLCSPRPSAAGQPLP